MSFIERERERLAVALNEPQTPERWGWLYAAQQALAWAAEPNAFAPPYATIMRGGVQPPTGIQEGLADCLESVHRPPS